MAASLCKLKDKLPEKSKKIAQLLIAPTHMCLKCGRSSNDSNRLCKSILLADVLK